jgi:hypothetical protein
VLTFEPAPGERFDARRHSGVGRIVTTDPEADGCVARTAKPGFARPDGTVVRVAEVEVFRPAMPPPSAPALSEKLAPGQTIQPDQPTSAKPAEQQQETT